MLIATLQILGGFVLLALGAEGLVRGGAGLALRFGVSTLVVGLTVVALGTSAPELVVCVKASLEGNAGLAVGNVIGSNIFNVAAILGLSALVFPVACQSVFVKRELPVMFFVGFLAPAFALLGGRVPEAEHPTWLLERWAGFTLIALSAGYILFTYFIARHEKASVLEAFEQDAISGGAETARKTPIFVDFLLIAGGVGLLVVGADLLTDGAVHIAATLGVSQTIIGLTIVGAGTGLPELATSLVAAFRRHSDIAVGNVIGSNVMNVLFILGASAAIAPLPVESAVIFRDSAVMLGLFLLCFPLMFTHGRITRWEGGILLAVYIAYLGLLAHQARLGSAAG